MTYLEYLIYVASNAIGVLSDGIKTAMQMDDEAYSIHYLESQLKIVPTLTLINPDPDGVDPRPDVEAGLLE